MARHKSAPKLSPKSNSESPRESSHNSNIRLHQPPSALPALGGIIDALTLNDSERMPPRAIAELQASPEGYNLWRRMSDASVAYWAAVEGSDPLFAELVDYVTTEFGEWTIKAVSLLINRLVAKYHITREEAK